MRCPPLRPDSTHLPPGRWLVRFWLTLVLSIPGFTAHADERRYYFDEVGSERGLASHSVNALYQDRIGYLWIGTQGGLHRYDGYRYVLYQHANDDPASLPDNIVTALAEDARGRLWVGSMTRGLAALDPPSGKVVATSQVGAVQARPRDNITALAFDASRGLWIGTTAGIELMDVDSGKRRELFRFPGGRPDVRVFDLAVGGDGTLWAATSTGLLRFAPHGETAQAVASADIKTAFGIQLGADGAVYAGTNLGLYRIDPAQDTALRLWPSSDSAHTGPQVRSLAQDHHGRLWLGVFGTGLDVYDPATGSTESMRHAVDMPGSLPDDYTTRLMIDRSGRLWIGGQIGGVATADPDGVQFRYVMDPSTARSQMSNVIRAIGEDRQGRLWLGTEGDGLKRYDPENDSFEYFDDVFKSAAVPDPYPQRRVAGVAPAGGDKLWVATNGGVFLFNPATRHADALAVDPDHGNGLPDASARVLLPLRDGSLWVGTYGHGLAHWQPATATQPERWDVFHHQSTQADSVANDLVLALSQGSDGRIWIGTVDGLSVYDPQKGSMRSFRHDPANAKSLGDNLIRTLYRGDDGTLWIGTQNGLDRVDVPESDDLTFVHYSTRNGLPGTTVLGILEDAEHNIWLSTNHGIGVYSRALGKFLDFNLEDGLQGLEFNAGAAYKRANGELVFGGLHGINLFDPEHIRHDTYQPPVVITDIRVGNQADPARVPADGLVMAQSQRVVRINFAALDYASPNRNRFVYRLQGFDPDWVDSGTRHDATYTNLPAGDYQFEVRASNRDGVWNEAGISLPLRVTPAWWATRLMQVLCAIAIATLLCLLWFGYRNRRQKEQHHLYELHEREIRLRLALWGSGDEFWDLDMRTDTLCRIGADQLVGGHEEETLSADDWRQRVVHPDDLPQVEQRLSDHVEGRSDFFESEHRIRNAGGDWIWVLSRGKVVERDADGATLRVCGTSRNITASRLAERDRRIASSVIGSMSEAVSVTDLDFRFVSVNRAFIRMLGHEESEILGQFSEILDSSRHTPQHYRVVHETLHANGHWRGELWQKRKNGEEFLCWIEIVEVRDETGNRTHYVAVMADITDRKRAEQELRYLANYDTLTGLPNRALLGERLAHAVIRARRTSRKVAVLFLDLDRFKHVNDSMGHATGDRVLKAVGSRLRASVPEAATVARLGGDEFTVVLEDIEHANEPQNLASKLLDVFSNPLTLDSGQEVVISPSIGISLYPDHGQVPTDLLKYADTAMYQAKEDGRNMYMLYTPAMDALARQRASMIGALRLALERNELSLVYQPMLDLDEGRITGTEALLRWHNPEHGNVPPAVFIPLAEEAGLIGRIGEFVLYRACTQLREWQERGLRGVTMSVNLSALQLLRDELTQRLCEILAELQLEPQQIELELTESVLMANAELAIHTLDRLHTLGVSIAIDDFGTGYSSLSYLKRLPIDTIKIDRSFVGDLTTDPDDEAITKTIITMAHSLGLNVIAEGVETLEQLEYLHEQRCDEIQGHWLSPPLNAADCFTFVREFEHSRSPVRPRRSVR